MPETKCGVGCCFEMSWDFLGGKSILNATESKNQRLRQTFTTILARCGENPENELSIARKLDKLTPQKRKPTDK